MKISLLLFNKIIFIFFVILLFGCVSNKLIQTNDVAPHEGIIHENNKYLGYIENKKNNIITRIYVYEKYVIKEVFKFKPDYYDTEVITLKVYNRYKNINYNDYENQQAIFETIEYDFFGVYDNYLFLNEPSKNNIEEIFTNGEYPFFEKALKNNYIIIDLNNNETIFRSVYYWIIGIYFAEPYILNILEYSYERFYEEYDKQFHEVMFDNFLFNLKTREKINMNKQIESTVRLD
jgi:hypothetical protein